MDFQIQIILEGDNEAFALHCSPDGKYIAYSSGSFIKIYNMELRKYGMILEGLRAPIKELKYSPDGLFLATASRFEANRYQIRIWDLATQISYILEENKQQIESLQFSPDGVHIASRTDKAIKIWNWYQKIQVTLFMYQTTSFHYSPRGYIILAHKDRCIRVLNANNGHVVRTKSVGMNNVCAMNHSSKQHLLVLGNRKGIISIWNTQHAHKLIKSLKGHKNLINTVAFSPDSNYIVTGSWDKTVRLWSTATGQELGLFKDKGQQTSVKTVQFSQNGKNIITGGFRCIVTPINKMRFKHTR